MIAAPNSMAAITKAITPAVNQILARSGPKTLETSAQRKNDLFHPDAASSWGTGLKQEFKTMHGTIDTDELRAQAGNPKSFLDRDNWMRAFLAANLPLGGQS